MENATLTRRSPFSGNINTMEFPMPVVEFWVAHANWQNGMLIQDAFPNLNADQREFIMTGITAEEWDETFGEKE